ncbi:MAG: ATP-binding cassette domain-containing protein [Rikenellaceae bacterium]|jgi:cell division transport system ATP-binding protein|nr:ATP-binding cassette domain-containing protein [Rikenellaceae bacterium]
MNSVIELRGAAIYHPGDSGRESDLILSNVNVAIGKGELVYLIGRVGSGKSSFLKTLYADLPLQTGEGRIAGYDLRHLRPREVPLLRRRLGIVFQDFQLLADRNVYENLRFVLRATEWTEESKIERRIEEVLGLVDLGHKAYRMPFQLSGGEQQRLSIARALLNHPEVILADEPTGNLDPAAAELIMRIFDDAIRTTGCSVVMATHNITNIHNFPSRTLRFAQGRIEDIDVQHIFGRTTDTFEPDPDNLPEFSDDTTGFDRPNPSSAEEPPA